MHKLVTALLGATALCLASTSYATTTIDFTNPLGLVPGPITHRYYATLAPSLYVDATGYGWNSTTGAFSTTNLYGKSLTGDEIGLGLNSDPSGQHEIYRGAFIQLDVTDLVGKVTSAMFHFGSDTLNEQWEVYGSNVAGSFLPGDALLYGRNDEGNHDLLTLGGAGWGHYTYYDFRSLGTGTGGINGFANSTTGNVLLGNLVLTPSVPEPATWAMMLVGFGGIGMAMRRRRQPALAQIA